jgi:hypothetical protein
MSKSLKEIADVFSFVVREVDRIRSLLKDQPGLFQDIASKGGLIQEYICGPEAEMQVLELAKESVESYPELKGRCKLEDKRDVHKIIKFHILPTIILCSLLGMEGLGEEEKHEHNLRSDIGPCRKAWIYHAAERNQLHAFHDRDPNKSWAWFVQATRRISQHDSEILI